MLRTCTLMNALLLSALACGGEDGTASEPSFNVQPDRELLAKIDALPENTWLKLPPCRTAGELDWEGSKNHRKWGPGVRDYCNKLVWAPDRKRALYCGAGHNIHPYNDVWEFDLAANTWICLFGADPAAPRMRKGKEEENLAWYKEHAVLKDGVIRTPRGAPLRPIHTWWGLCYDTHRKRLVFWDAHKGICFTDRDALAKALNVPRDSELLKGTGATAGEAWIFEFDPETRAWTEVLTNVPKAFECSRLEYLPEQKTLWLDSGKTYLLSPDRKTWQEVWSAGFPRQKSMTAYDPESRTIASIGFYETLLFDCKTNTWTQAHEKGPDSSRVCGGVFCYDSAAKRFVLLTTHRPEKDHPGGCRLWLYDLATNTWTQPKPEGPAPEQAGSGYYDPERNVTVIYSTTETWVYRCKKAGK